MEQTQFSIIQFYCTHLAFSNVIELKVVYHLYLYLANHIPYYFAKSIVFMLQLHHNQTIDKVFQVKDDKL